MKTKFTQKGDNNMSKRKIFIAALAVCLVAIISLGTLAWFTDEDQVTNNFHIANSDDTADEIFSIEVWERDTIGGDPVDTITYPDVQPGDDWYKEVNIENTGYYAQYVRATVTITGADVWYDVFDEAFFGLDKFATDLNTKDFYVDRIEFNADNNTIAYTLYYNDILVSAEEAAAGNGNNVVTLFTNVHIADLLDQYQAAELVGNKFNINVKAEAVQTENVPADAKEAFAYVDMGRDSGNFFVADTSEGAEKLEAILTGKENTAYLYFNTKESVSLDFSETNESVDATFVKNIGELEVIGGTANVGTSTDYGFIAEGTDAKTIINGTDIVSNGGGIGATSGAKVEFNDGRLTVEATTTNPRYNFYVVGAGSELTINGGEFDFTSKTLKRAYIYADAGTTVTINGGNFGNASTRSGYTAGILGEGTVVITGGTFGFDPSAWVASGYVATENAGVWTVTAQ